MEQLKGFRTLVTTYGAMLLGNIDVIRDVVQQVLEVVGAQVGEGGAVAALVVAAVTIKQVFTDAIPRMKGTLNK